MEWFSYMPQQPYSLDYPSDLGMGNPVHDLVVDMIGEKVIPCPKGTLVFPSRPHESLEWNSGQGSTGDLRVLIDRKVSEIINSFMYIMDLP